MVDVQRAQPGMQRCRAVRQQVQQHAGIQAAAETDQDRARRTGHRLEAGRGAFHDRGDAADQAAS